MTQVTGYIGRSVKRKEDARLLRGEGRYLDDLNHLKPKQVAFWRSPYAHARIKAVRTAEARELPGVIAVFTGEDFAPVKPLVTEIQLEGYVAKPQDPVARDKASHAGEIVAVVVAEDRYIAEDALELIEVDFEPLPAVVDVDAALAEGSSLVHTEVPGNIYYRGRRVFGEVEAAFAKAELVFRETFRTSRIAGTPLEARGCLAEYDPYQDVLTVWSSTQIPSILHLKLAEIFGMHENGIRIIAPDMGGGFGIKAQIYPEEIIIPFLARALRLPVKWVQDRREDLLTGVHARDHRYELEAAVTREGVLTALRLRMLTDAGAFSSFPFGCTLEATGGARMILGPYKIRNYEYDTIAVATNKAPAGAYRGVAQPSCFFAIEGLMDIIAGKLGLDPAEIRRRNMLSSAELPYTNPIGIHFDSGSYGESLEKALQSARYAEVRGEQSRIPADAGRQIGIGLACYTEISGISSKGYQSRGVADVPGYDSVRMRMDPSGTVAIYTTLTSQGQGHWTTFAQIAATELGIEPDQVRVVDGDTGLAPLGTGTFASRASITGGGAVFRAAREIKRILLRVAGGMLDDLPPEELELGEGFVRARGRKLKVTLREAARKAYEIRSGGSETREIPGLEVIAYYDPPPSNWSNAVHLAVVELNLVTGFPRFLDYVVVSDCGNLINPMIVDGQIQGGAAQGIGEALLEALEYDPGGQLLTASWGDYLIPTALDVPEMKIEHITTPCPSTEGGVKGMGEGGAIGALPAVVNAVNDALRRSRCWTGVPITRAPVKPEDILRRVGAVGAEGGDGR
ncbi:MAG: xanthine dehydrogenase family protein [Firmicutes bacterium]|nr:xanthine dehydrogenase family protein [Bacillota bacterium]